MGREGDYSGDSKGNFNHSVWQTMIVVSHASVGFGFIFTLMVVDGPQVNKFGHFYSITQIFKYIPVASKILKFRQEKNDSVSKGACQP